MLPDAGLHGIAELSSPGATQSLHKGRVLHHANPELLVQGLQPRTVQLLALEWPLIRLPRSRFWRDSGVRAISRKFTTTANRSSTAWRSQGIALLAQQT